MNHRLWIHSSVAALVILIVSCCIAFAVCLGARLGFILSPLSHLPALFAAMMLAWLLKKKGGSALWIVVPTGMAFLLAIGCVSLVFTSGDEEVGPMFVMLLPILWGTLLFVLYLVALAGSALFVRSKKSAGLNGENLRGKFS
jgi:hypothetical protein